MMRHTHPIRTFAIILMIALIPALSSCGSGAGGSASDGAAGSQDTDMRPVEKVLHTIIDAPNEELYHPSMTYIGLDAPAPTDEEIAAAEKAAEEEKAAWRAAIGDCFAGEMFDTFYNHFERTEFLGEAYVLKLTTVVTDISPRDAGGESSGQDSGSADETSGQYSGSADETSGQDSGSEQTGDGRVETLTVTVQATDETGHVDTYETVWQVRYDKNDPELLQSVKLKADGGFFCRTGCPL